MTTASATSATIPVLATARLRLDAFTDSDVPALAAILAEPEVSRNITADASSPERCRTSAVSRIAWHNASWAEHGYGVWALRENGGGALIGWCGFAEPDVGTDPEILYGLAPTFWRRGLATEAARAALAWLFRETAAAGASAVIFGRLNAASAAVLTRLGMRRAGTMVMVDFLPDGALAKKVVDYEIWRLGRSGHAAVPGAVQGRHDRDAARRSAGRRARALRGGAATAGVRLCRGSSRGSPDRRGLPGRARRADPRPLSPRSDGLLSRP